MPEVIKGRHKNGVCDAKETERTRSRFCDAQENLTLLRGQQSDPGGEKQNHERK